MHLSLSIYIYMCMYIYIYIMHMRICISVCNDNNNTNTMVKPFDVPNTFVMSWDCYGRQVFDMSNTDTNKSYIYIYVCMYVHTYVCVYMYTYIYIYLYIWLYGYFVEWPCRCSCLRPTEIITCVSSGPLRMRGWCRCPCSLRAPQALFMNKPCVWSMRAQGEHPTHVYICIYTYIYIHT